MNTVLQERVGREHGRADPREVGAQRDRCLPRAGHLHHVRRLVLIVAVDRVEVRRVAAGREAQLDAVGGVARDAVGLELHDHRARDAVLVSHSARGGTGRPPEAREGARQCARRHRLAHGVR